MKIRIASLFFLLAFGISLAIPSFSARAQAYPNKSLKIIVGYPPGGSTDVPARIVGQKLAEVLDQTVVVENKPGASGNIGAELAARGADAVGSTPEAFKAFIEAETLKWGKVIKDAKIVNQ